MSLLFYEMMIIMIAAIMVIKIIYRDNSNIYNDDG